MDPMIDDQYPFSQSALYLLPRKPLMKGSVVKVSLAKMEMKASLYNEKCKKLLKHV